MVRWSIVCYAKMVLRFKSIALLRCTSPCRLALLRLPFPLRTVCQRGTSDPVRQGWGGGARLAPFCAALLTLRINRSIAGAVPCLIGARPFLLMIRRPGMWSRNGKLAFGVFDAFSGDLL